MMSRYLWDSLRWAEAELRLLYQLFMPAVNFHHSTVLPSRYEQLRGAWGIYCDVFGSFLGVHGSCYAYGHTVPYFLKP